jgi:processive 1,2-diacylglycerol beta-glucosyltransferase
LVNRAPHLLGYFYDLLERPSRSGKKRGDRFRLAFEKINLRPFLALLCDHSWDLVINTHFLPAEIVASLRKKHMLRVPQVTVTTDFETHRLWVNQPCEHYYTATEEGARYLQHWGVSAQHITATGIPIHPVFSKPKDRGLMRKKHGLDADRPIVLQLAGGFGVGPVARLFQAILEVEQPLQLVAVSGKNEKAATELKAIQPPPRHRAKVLGFTHEIDELMVVADLVVSKPGGLTTSETLARGAAMVIVNPIPGQETRNSDFLLEQGAAIKINNLATLPYKIGCLLDDPKRLAQLKANATRTARPRAAFEIVDHALNLARSWSTS